MPTEKEDKKDKERTPNPTSAATKLLNLLNPRPQKISLTGLNEVIIQIGLKTHPTKPTIPLPVDLSALEAITYDDEVPPIPLDDYTPMDIPVPPPPNLTLPPTPTTYYLRTILKGVCKSCGNKLLKGDNVCPVCGYVYRLKGVCKSCGTKLLKGDKVCPLCGHICVEEP